MRVAGGGSERADAGLAVPLDAADGGGVATDDRGVAAIHRSLRLAILRGDLQPGSLLSQIRLARDLGVSRTPLREALRMLQREGLVRSEPNRQVQVAPLSAADVEELYVARLALEAVAIRLTVPRLRPEEIARMAGDLAEMAHFQSEGDYERWEVSHRIFHHRLVVHAGTRVLALLDELYDHSERYRRLYTTTAPRAWSHGAQDHLLIADAVKRGDADSAARRLAAHLAHTARGVVALVSPHAEPSRLDETVTQLVGAGDPWL
jgi:DNA-binding GntR family transcriptional regulator